MKQKRCIEQRSSLLDNKSCRVVVIVVLSLWVLNDQAVRVRAVLSSRHIDEHIVHNFTTESG